MASEITRDYLLRAGLAEDEAEAILVALREVPQFAMHTWKHLTRSVLRPEHPFEVHRLVYDALYEKWPQGFGPRQAWYPDYDEKAITHVSEACLRNKLPDYAALHRWSIENRSEFWYDIIARLGVRFHVFPRVVLDDSAGPEAPRWFPGAKLNIAETCFNVPDWLTAIVHQREGGPIEKVTYGELKALANRFANGLREFGLRPGARVAIAMPMTLEAVAAYIGIVKAGCAVVSIADSFAPEEIRTRLELAGAAVAVTSDVVGRGGRTFPMYDKVVAAGARVCIVVPKSGEICVKLRKLDCAWADFLSGNDRFDAHPCDPDDPSNILFSSGTTGEPKAIPWTHTTPIKCAMDGYYHHNIQESNVVAWPTNLGWMMGPWLIYATLINRATIALCEYAPNTREFCRFVSEAEVTMLGVVPSLVKTWRAQALTDGLDWTKLRAFSSTGEASNPDDYLWLMSRARYRPIIEYCGGTEIGGGFITQTLVQPASPSLFSTPALGLDVVILDDEGRPASKGELFVVGPSIGLSQTLLNRDHHDVYFAGTPRGPKGEVLRRHGDQFEAIEGGYYRTLGRADDTMNLGGIKVSSAEIERALAGVDGIADVAAIAVEPPGGGPSLLVLYAVARAGAAVVSPEELRRAAQQAIAAHLNPLFRVHEVRLVDALPRTASNKVMRRVLRDQYRS